MSDPNQRSQAEETQQGGVADQESAGELATSDAAATETGQTAEPEAAQTAEPAAKPEVKRTRMGILWSTLVVAAIVLVLLLIFIVQNSQSMSIYFFGAQGKLPAGVALLLAAVGGVLLVAIPGYGRILQLRRAVRKAGGPQKKK